MTDKQWELFDTDTFSGFETDPTMLRISAMNLMLHSIIRSEVKWQDSISKNNEIKDRYDLILANPLFTGTVDEENINPALTRKLIELIIKEGGFDGKYHLQSCIF